MTSPLNTWASVLRAQSVPDGADRAVAQVSESFLPDDLCTETPPTKLSEDATKKLEKFDLQW